MVELTILKMAQMEKVSSPHLFVIKCVCVCENIGDLVFFFYMQLHNAAS